MVRAPGAAPSRTAACGGAYGFVMAAVKLPELTDYDALYISVGGVAMFIVSSGDQNCTRVQRLADGTQRTRRTQRRYPATFASSASFAFPNRYFCRDRRYIPIASMSAADS